MKPYCFSHSIYHAQILRGWVVWSLWQAPWSNGKQPYQLDQLDQFPVNQELTVLEIGPVSAGSTATQLHFSSLQTCHRITSLRSRYRPYRTQLSTCKLWPHTVQDSQRGYWTLPAMMCMFAAAAEIVIRKAVPVTVRSSHKDRPRIDGK